MRLRIIKLSVTFIVIITLGAIAYGFYEWHKTVSFNKDCTVTEIKLNIHYESGMNLYSCVPYYLLSYDAYGNHYDNIPAYAVDSLLYSNITNVEMNNCYSHGWGKYNPITSKTPEYCYVAKNHPKEPCLFDIWYKEKYYLDQFCSYHRNYVGFGMAIGLTGLAVVFFVIPFLLMLLWFQETKNVTNINVIP